MEMIDFIKTIANGTLTPETIQFAQAQLKSREIKIQKHLNSISSVQREIDEQVLSVLSNKPMVISNITELVNERYNLTRRDAYTCSKVTASLRRLIRDGLVKNEVVKKYSYYYLSNAIGRLKWNC